MAGNEAAAIGTMRALVSAETAYAASNGGLFDTPECLVAPAKCLPQYSGPPLVDPAYSSDFTKSGYIFRFYPGAPADSATARARQLSPTSVTTFSYVAVPETPRSTGTRSFCGDSSGEVCSLAEDAVTDREGACPASCLAIR